MKISIIIPAHNEEKRISNTLEEYCKFFEKRKKNKELKDFEILVVLNACKDRTIDVVKKTERKFKEIKHIEFEQGGKGFAIKEGFRYSIKKDFDLIGFVDADMSTSPEEYFRLASQINSYDGIIASRYLPMSIVKPKPKFLRMIVSRIFNFLIRSSFFFPYLDTQCGAKVFKKEAIKIVLPYLIITQWAFDVDLLYLLRKKRFKIKEVPTVWSDKEYSKINFIRAGPFMILSLIRLRILNSPLYGIVKIYDKMPGWIKIHNKLR